MGKQRFFEAFPDKHGNLRPAIWKDEAGVVHRAVGAILEPRSTAPCLWTACGSADVPAGKSWLQDQPVTCQDCKQEYPDAD